MNQRGAYAPAGKAAPVMLQPVALGAPPGTQAPPTKTTPVPALDWEGRAVQQPNSPGPQGPDDEVQLRPGLEDTTERVPLGLETAPPSEMQSSNLPWLVVLLVLVVAAAALAAYFLLWRDSGNSAGTASQTAVASGRAGGRDYQQMVLDPLGRELVLHGCSSESGDRSTKGIAWHDNPASVVAVFGGFNTSLPKTLLTPGYLAIRRQPAADRISAELTHQGQLG